MNKYRNKKCEYLGYKFHSLKEMRRYQELLLLEKAGEISKIELQVRIPIIINDYMICVYITDFKYVEYGLIIYEDVKSEATRKLPVYRIKKKLVFALWNIAIRES